MKIVSFNINGLRARLHQLQQLIDSHQPDIIGLQETKVHDEAFPLAEVEAAHIKATLDACHWRISGPRGAASSLGLPPSTLRSRMQKLGICRQGS